MSITYNLPGFDVSGFEAERLAIEKVSQHILDAGGKLKCGEPTGDGGHWWTLNWEISDPQRPLLSVIFWITRGTLRIEQGDETPGHYNGQSKFVDGLGDLAESLWVD